MLYIIVPVHNRKDTTLKFIQSLQEQSFKDYRLIVVDDGSTDGTKSIIYGKYPETVILDGNGSLFWGGGINLGLEYVERLVNESDYIAFANNDILFESDTIMNIMYYAQKEKAVFHSLVIKADNQIISSGAKLINWPLFITKHPLRGKSLNEISADKILVDLMTARFVIFSSLVLDSYNRIDTNNFPHYIGDNDFSMSLSKKGIPTYIITSSHCLVDINTTGENPQKLKSFKAIWKSLYSIRSTNNLKYRYHFGKKHCPKLYLPIYLFSMILQVILLNLIRKRI